MSELTPERLAELRRIAEAGPAGEWDMIELEHSTVLALLDEIERLRNVAIDPGECGIDEPVVDWKRTAELRAQEIERLRNVAIDPGEYGIDEPVVDWKRTAELRAQEIERLRREREVLVEAVMGWQRYLERDVGTEIVHVRTLEAHGRALALLEGEKGGGRA